MMRFHRYVSRPWHRALGLMLVLLTTFLSCTPTAMAARGSRVETFSDTQIAQIRKARTQMEIAQSRMGELKDYVDAEDWTYTSNFIRGPLGALRQQAATINRNLPTKAQKDAYQKARALMTDIENLDLAAKQDNARLAARKYGEVVASLDAYLETVPVFEPDVADEPAAIQPAPAAAPSPAKAVPSQATPASKRPAEVVPAEAPPIQAALEQAETSLEELGERAEAAVEALGDRLDTALD